MVDTRRARGDRGPVDVSQLSPSNQDYLKALLSLREKGEEQVTASLLAQRVGVRLSSASDAIRRLDKAGLVTHQPYGAVQLTPQGHAFAVEMLRRHRLIESFLVEVLGYTWDEVHQEAESLEHCVSASFVERVDSLLKFPERDPHGDPIPHADGTYPVSADVPTEPLAEVPEGSVAVIDRIDDSDSQLLQYLSTVGVCIGVQIRVESAGQYAGGHHYVVDGAQEPVLLSKEAAAAISVRRLPNL